MEIARGLETRPHQLKWQTSLQLSYETRYQEPSFYGLEGYKRRHRQRLKRTTTTIKATQNRRKKTLMHGIQCLRRETETITLPPT